MLRRAPAPGTCLTGARQSNIRQSSQRVRQSAQHRKAASLTLGGGRLYFTLRRAPAPGTCLTGALGKAATVYFSASLSTLEVNTSPPRNRCTFM